MNITKMNAACENRTHRAAESRLRGSLGGGQWRTPAFASGLNLGSEVLRALTEGSPDIILVVGRDGIIKYVNRAGAAQIHEEPRQLIGRELSSLFPQAGVAEQAERLAHVLATGESIYREAPWRFAHGDRWVGTWMTPLRDAHGNIVAVLGVGHDLTVRKSTEKALRDSEERYRRLVELAPYGLFVHQGGHIVFVNSAGVELLGARRHDELIGRAYLDFVPAQFLGAAKRRIEQVLELGARTPFQESQLVRLDGLRVDVEETSIPFEYEGQPAVQVIARDVTETKRLAHALEQSRARFEQIFRGGPAAMWLATVGEGRFIDANESFLQMLGFKREEITGQTARGLGIWNEPEEWESLSNLVCREGSVHSFEAQFVDKSKRVRDVIVSVETVRFSAGPCLLFAALDVTDRKQLERQLIESQKLEAIGQLARGVAHDFNNILTIIQGHTRLIRMQNGFSAPVDESLQQIEEAAKRAANLTQQLLAFSRRQPMQPRVTDLNDVIQAMTQMMRRSIGEDIVLEFSPTQPLMPVMADVGMIEQLLLNLAVNARDAMPKGGRLTLSTATHEIAAGNPARSPECQPGQYVCVTVQDTGAGIAPETLSRIFEPFFTTKQPGKGTGLGLATVRSIVQQHKGWIEVESEQGRGTTFRVFLPAVRSACPKPEANTKPTVMPTGAETVLVVEDEAELRELCREVLQRCGYNVVTAADGQEAMGVWHRLEGKVDLLLSDVIMPGGMDGWDLAQSLANEAPGLRVILTSGYRFDSAKSRSTWYLRWRLLEKPYVPEALAQVVRETLDVR